MDATRPPRPVALAGYRIEALARPRRAWASSTARTTWRLEAQRRAQGCSRPSLAEDATFRERFLVESRLAASLDHPNVIPIYEAGEAGGLALPRDALRRGHRPRSAAADEGALAPERAMALLSQVAERARRGARGAVSSIATSSRRTSGLLPAPAWTRKDHAYLADFGLIENV